MNFRSSSLPLIASAALALAAFWPVDPARGQNEPPPPAPAATDPASSAEEEQTFTGQIQPLIQKHCLRCHNAEQMESGIRVDQLSASPTDRQIFLLNDIQKQLADGAMPPPEEPQPTKEERQKLSNWITRTVAAARTRNTQKNGSIRRLTVSQYRNTLKDLLKLDEDLADVLPPDGISKDGFANHGQTMVLSPLQVESYFDIAEKALALCIVDEHAKPTIENFRMDFGTAINPHPCPDNLVLGALSMLLNNADFVVTELQPEKPFPYQPFVMRKAYEFIEGYVGNDTIREWKKFDSIYHSVFACVRGTPGYPKGEPYQVAKDGLLLRPAIPSPEIFGQSNTYGPMANFKISLRELPEQGNFRITVNAARYDDGLLLDAGATAAPAGSSSATVDLTMAAPQSLSIKDAGVYQVDLACSPGKPQGLLSLNLANREFAGQLFEPAAAQNGAPGTEHLTPFLVLRLPAGEHPLTAKYADNSRLRRLVCTKLADDSDTARRFAAFEKRRPSLGVYLGLRRDCGSTLTPVGQPRVVAGGELQQFVFEGAIKDYPNPDVEKDNVNYLAGIREIGVRSEYTDGRDMPRLLIRSIEFEGPYYTSWPPTTHQNIFVASAQRADAATYAREILSSFATRAFRRPVTPSELETLTGIWQRSYTEHMAAQGTDTLAVPAGSTTTQSPAFRKSIQDALLIVLTSPQFLFLIENSAGPQPEDLDAYELASKLSYFLWNGPPDQRLLDLAAANTLQQSLESEVERMIADARFDQFNSEFAAQWLSLDKFDVVSIDAQRYPRLTRDAKTHLRQEPVQFLRYLIAGNLPASLLIKSDFILANEIVASYYNLGDRTESGFEFEAIPHRNQNLGGLLTQASILSGLSDGRESNPIKRGAWLARKIVAEPPDDPPPNVPKLPENDGQQLTLRERLERHRNQKGCAKCHEGIDPWGIPLEAFDASGMLKQADKIDLRSTLPDGTQIGNPNELKRYLATDRIDQVAFSFMKHVACYATGRSLTYNEIQFLHEQGKALKATDYRLQDLIKFVVTSDLFLKK